ncbi:hypothetical protein HKX48_001458 [Thoreauomyces humboldtii]|nr:hypothetical protein HKX48_001458 [Thoreauomyces humboldtii]
MAFRLLRIGTAVYRQGSARVFAHARCLSPCSPTLASVTRARKLSLNQARTLATQSSAAAARVAPLHDNPSGPIGTDALITPAAWVEVDGTVAVRFPDGSVSRFHGIWLRDHCRCPSCFHPVTKQRLVDTSAIPLSIKPAVMSVEGDQLSILWETEDAHRSLVSLDWLRTNSYAPKLGPPVAASTPYAAPQRVKRLWDASIADSLPTVQYADVMNPARDEVGLAAWLHDMDVYGLAFVDGVPPTPEATQALGERVSFIRETHYGRFWEFTSDLAHGDTAYTQLGLPAHTDGTYFTDPVGLQLFHLLAHDGRGGQSLYVDGFHVADQLRRTDPRAYETLSTVRFSAHSAGDANTLVEPAHPFSILNHDQGSPRSLYQIRFNNDDRSTLTGLAPGQVAEFYRALKVWTDLLRDPANELWIALRPGRAVMVDNWRVLHGRAPFDGHRRVCGSYHNWDDYRSRVKTVLDKRTVV